MSDFCSTFVPDFNRNMKKTYIQPEIETMVLAAGENMMVGDPASGGTFPSILPSNPAPRKRDQVF